MRLVMVTALAAALALSCASQPQPAAPITKSSNTPPAAPAVGLAVADQRSLSSSILVAEVDSSDYGWIVVRDSSAGASGPVLGVAYVMPGVTRSLSVRLSMAAAGSYVAYLHLDRGTKGVFEAPGADESFLVSKPFAILN